MMRKIQCTLQSGLRHLKPQRLIQMYTIFLMSSFDMSWINFYPIFCLLFKGELFLTYWKTDLKAFVFWITYYKSPICLVLKSKKQRCKSLTRIQYHFYAHCWKGFFHFHFRVMLTTITVIIVLKFELQKKCFHEWNCYMGHSVSL